MFLCTNLLLLLLFFVMRFRLHVTHVCTELSSNDMFSESFTYLPLFCFTCYRCFDLHVLLVKIQTRFALLVSTWQHINVAKYWYRKETSHFSFQTEWVWTSARRIYQYYMYSYSCTLINSILHYTWEGVLVALNGLNNNWL